MGVLVCLGFGEVLCFFVWVFFWFGGFLGAVVFWFFSELRSFLNSASYKYLQEKYLIQMFLSSVILTKFMLQFFVWLLLSSGKGI